MEHQFGLNKNKQEDVNFMNSLAIEVCINGVSLNKFKTKLDTVDGLYVKCEKFVALFLEMKGNGEHFSNVALNKFLFQGKQIWLTEETLSLLTAVLKGKSTNPAASSKNEEVPNEEYLTPSNNTLSSDDFPQEEYLKKESSFSDELPHTLEKDKDWHLNFKQISAKKLIAYGWSCLKINRKICVGIAVAIVALFVLWPSLWALKIRWENEARLQNAINKICLTTELGTVEYKVKLAHVEKDPNVIFDYINSMTSYVLGTSLAGERAMVIVSMATLKAGIDLRGFSKNNVHVDGNSIEITLPRAKILSRNIDLSNTDCHLYSSGLRSDYVLSETSKSKQYAEKDLLNFEEKCSIIEEAQKNAEDFLTALLKQLGYTTITIKFSKYE